MTPKTSQMRSLVLTNMAAPYRHALFNRIAEQQPELHVVYFRRRGAARDWTVDMTLARYKYSILSMSSLPTMRSLIRLVALLLKNRKQKILIGGWGGVEHAIAIILCTALRVKWGLWIGLQRPISPSSLKGRTKLLVLRRANFIVCYHKMTASLVRDHVNTKKQAIYVGRNVGDIEAVYNGVMQCREKAPRERKAFAFVGSLTNAKGVDLLLRAVREKKISYDLVLIGNGALEEDARKLSGSGSDSGVEIAGFLEGEDLYQKLAECSGLILPTRRDVGAIVVGEALAAGLPVLVSDADGGAYEFAHQFPTYVRVFQADNYEAMCEAIQEFESALKPPKQQLAETFRNSDLLGVYAKAFSDCLG
jgi:glycosyltransferase involved in cell wall biosynthesis